MLPKSVPWLDWDEWLFIYNGFFFPLENRLLLDAINVVHMWRARGKVPHSILCTADLLSVSFMHYLSLLLLVL